MKRFTGMLLLVCLALFLGFLLQSAGWEPSLGNPFNWRAPRLDLPTPSSKEVPPSTQVPATSAAAVPGATPEIYPPGSNTPSASQVPVRPPAAALGANTPSMKIPASLLSETLPGGRDFRVPKQRTVDPPAQSGGRIINTGGGNYYEGCPGKVEKVEKKAPPKKRVVKKQSPPPAAVQQYAVPRMERRTERCPWFEPGGCVGSTCY